MSDYLPDGGNNLNDLIILIEGGPYEFVVSEGVPTHDYDDGGNNLNDPIIPIEDVYEFPVSEGVPTYDISGPLLSFHALQPSLLQPALRGQEMGLEPLPEPVVQCQEDGSGVSPNPPLYQDAEGSAGVQALLPSVDPVNITASFGDQMEEEPQPGTTNEKQERRQREA